MSEPIRALSSPPEFMVYASFAKCGCIAAMTVDRPEYAKDTAKTVAGWIKSGYTVRRLPDSEMHELWDARQPKWGPCLHEKPQQTNLAAPA